MIKIKNRYSGAVMHSVDVPTISEAMERLCRDRANLGGADLVGADLRGAYLVGADLVGANLVGANLVGANLGEVKGADLAIAMTRILPAGRLIVWKKCYTKNGPAVVKLAIPEDAKRSHAFGRKCRAEYAEVLEIEGDAVEAWSSHDGTFAYRVGETVRPKEPFSDEWTEECASGIHFFITREEAAAY